MTVLDYESDSKVFVKYKIIGSGTKCKYIFPYLESGLDSRFLLGMKCSFPVPIAIGTERINEMESQKCGLCPRLC